MVLIIMEEIHFFIFFLIIIFKVKDKSIEQILIQVFVFIEVINLIRLIRVVYLQVHSFSLLLIVVVNIVLVMLNLLDFGKLVEVVVSMVLVDNKIKIFVSYLIIEKILV